MCYPVQHTGYNLRLLKARRYGYLPTDFLSIEDLLDSNEESLFRSILYNPQHVLHQLLPPPKHTDSRGHGLTRSVVPSEFMRKNFINRMLFNQCHTDRTILCLHCCYFACYTVLIL